MRGMQLELGELSSLRIFANLIIREVVDSPLLDRLFLQVYIASLMLRKSDDQGDNRYVGHHTLKI